MEKLHSIHYLKKKKESLNKNNIYPFIVYQIYGFRWCKSNQLTQFVISDEKDFPIGSKCLSIKRGKFDFKKKKSRKIIPLFLQERTKRVSYPANLNFILKYRYCIVRFRCERLFTSYFMGRAKECELYKLTIALIK